jgi:hypothetical protein
MVVMMMMMNAKLDRYNNSKLVLEKKCEASSSASLSSFFFCNPNPNEITIYEPSLAFQRWLGNEFENERMSNEQVIL